MAQAARRADSGDEMGEENAQEMELARLQKQMRVKESDRRAYTEDSRNLLRKQEAEITTLLKENEEIHTILRLAQSEKNEEMDTENATHLRELIQTLDSYNREADEERNKIKNLDAEIKKMESQINEDRKSSCVKSNHGSSMSTDKRIRVMENRLDKATVHFNQQLASNGQLRQEIDHLRQERAVFDNLYKRLSKELDELKKQKAVVIQEASQAYEERDEAKNKMVALQERSDKDQNQHGADMKELQRIINHDNKLKEFMIAKAQDRAIIKAEEETKKKKGDGLERNNFMEKQIIESYEDAFLMIKEITGEDDLDNIVNDFIHKEDENFALFNYVNELNDETEKLQEEVSSLKKDIKMFKQDNIRMDEDRKVVMKELEIRANKAHAEADDCEKQHTEVRKALEELKDGIASLFKNIDCDPFTINDMLGSEDGVTDKNVMQYLGLVEQRTMDLLHIHQYTEMKNKRASKEPAAQTPATTAGSQKTATPAASAPPTIAPPTLGAGDEFSDDESEELTLRPMTRDELTQMVMNHLNRHPSMAPMPNNPNPTPNQPSTMKERKKSKY